MNKQVELLKIEAQIKACNRCKQNSVGVAVPGEGSPDAQVVFIGEAPGKQEAKTGRPFIGRAGKVLRALIAQAGLTEFEVFITSPVKYLPEYVTPTVEDVKHGRIHLNKQLSVINPRFVVLLGRVACLALLKRHVEVSKAHGQLVQGENGITYFISYHPAAALYSPKLRSVLETDFKLLNKLIK